MKRQKTTVDGVQRDNISATNINIHDRHALNIMCHFRFFPLLFPLDFSRLLAFCPEISYPFDTYVTHNIRSRLKAARFPFSQAQRSCAIF